MCIYNREPVLQVGLLNLNKQFELPVLAACFRDKYRKKGFNRDSETRESLFFFFSLSLASVEFRGAARGCYINDARRIA
jgi:hypothetical protein